MTKRAKRLADYLENELGWEVYSDKMNCPKCQNVSYGTKFCSNCGTKMKKVKDQAIEEIEDALKFALNEE